ncbi:unnamed protein product [Pseudo-nitzschia multistriata]|uniref:MIP18 family-like domain-containing protein n=1 Tax=Pseudo-nitzschia multistriata TaxID=183589 RepID=A0A448ZMT7_9STRA|nr:unnamed protein product [Pseudo-nitzschia multistriata]
MENKSSLRIVLTIAIGASLLFDCNAFVTRTTTTSATAKTYKQAQPEHLYLNQNQYYSGSSSTLLSSVTDDDSTTTTSENIPIPNEWQGEVLKTLKSIIDPDLGQDIVTLGFVQNLKLDEAERKVSFDVELTTPACPVKETFRSDCERLVSALPFVGSVDVTMTAQEPSNTETDTSGMAGIGAIIAVSSCKGGVGKSTTSVNLAYALQSQGASVGIFDCDVYGPSLPTMVEPDDDMVRFVGRQIAPLQRNGVRLMSFGYINDGSAIMRGPMVSQLLDQFLSVTQWGSLDYLILDMPPGTGDIQLTLTQRLNITAAVIVTTPQELSFADVVRGVEMFDTVDVPCVAVVENMAYYDSDPASQVNNKDELEEDVRKMLAEKGLLNNGDGDKFAEELVQTVLKNAKTDPVQIFGPGHKKRLSDQWGIEHTYSMPLMDRIAANGDSGTPYVLENPESSQTQIYRELAKSVVSEVAKAKFASRRPEIEYIEEFNIIQVDDEPLDSATLRRACRCAACVEELTGKQILKASDVSDDIKPLRMSGTGNYALSVDWSDGHRSLYPYRQIRSLIGQDEDNTALAPKTTQESESTESDQKACSCC